MKQPAEIRPEIEALDYRIQGALAAERATTLFNADRTWLLRSFEVTIPPEALIDDRLLEPVDKILWLVLERHAGSVEQSAQVPSYRQLAAAANVTSKITVARAITALRCTRWLTICERYGLQTQRKRGRVFLLHRQPLPLPDTLFLDPGYLDFLRRSRCHSHRSVRSAVAAVMAECHRQASAPAGLEPRGPV